MGQQRSNSYEQLQQALAEGFLPTELTTTHMLIHGGRLLPGGTAAAVLRAVEAELTTLLAAAKRFDVMVSMLLDEENVAIVALNGQAKHVGDLAAFMANPKATSAR